MNDFIIQYVGRMGAVNLNTYPYLLKTKESTLFDYELNYNTSDSVWDNRSTASNFGIKGREKTLLIQIKSGDKKKAIDRLDYIFNYDVSEEEPGRLYINDSYVNCYITKVEYQDFDNYSNMEAIEYTVLFQNGKWITEDKHEYLKDAGTLTSGSFKFPFSFPFSFSQAREAMTINNQSYSSSKAMISFYGPCSNPSVTINGNTYGVTCELLLGERVEIDPLQKTVEKVTGSGARINYINKRFKNNSIFTPIQSGNNEVLPSSKFSFSITLLNEKNQPSWTFADWDELNKIYTITDPEIDAMFERYSV